MPRSKYKNVPTQIDGITFHSKKEAERYGVLMILQRSGKISNLELQPKYKLTVEGKHIANYIADFTYFDRQCVRPVVEDVKGMKTPVYNLKKKLFLALYGASCEFRET